MQNLLKATASGCNMLCKTGVRCPDVGYHVTCPRRRLVCGTAVVFTLLQRVGENLTLTACPCLHKTLRRTLGCALMQWKGPVLVELYRYDNAAEGTKMHLNRFHPLAACSQSLRREKLWLACFLPFHISKRPIQMYRKKVSRSQNVYVCLFFNT